MSGTEFQIENGVLTAYTGQGSRVTLPEGLRVIGKEAFAGCAPLASVTFPGGRKRLARGRFSAVPICAG